MHIGIIEVDEDSMVAVLLALALETGVGLQPPVDFSGVWPTFVSISILIGYFYLVRTASRIPVALYEFLRRAHSFDVYNLLFVETTRTAEKFVLVACAFIGGIPAIHGYVTLLGYVGITIMIVIYLLGMYLETHSGGRA